MASYEVHQGHCCKGHGCKYGDVNYCPVWTGSVVQDYPCEMCDFDKERIEKILHEIFDFEMNGATSKAFYAGLKARGLKVVGIND